MKKIVIILLLLPTYGYAQWLGDVNSFSFLGDRVVLNAPFMADTAAIFQPSTVSVNAYWEIQVQLDFLPSSANYARIYVMSNEPQLKGPLQGYFVQIGGANRQIALYKQSGKSCHVLTASDPHILEDEAVNLTLVVERNASYEWQVLVKYPNGALLGLPKVKDEEFLYAEAWGIWCKYTKTRSQAFSFSDIYVHGQSLTPPPVVQKGQLYLSEILYDPPYGGVDFVELYNATQQDLYLETCSLSNGKSFCVLPVYTLPAQGYVALTSDTIKLREQYQEVGEALVCPRFPSFKNDSGMVLLYTAADTLDVFHYSDDLHHPLVSQTEGISLERRGLTADWTSAATLVEATPGLPNSNASAIRPDEKPDHKMVWLSQAWFSPYETVGGIKIYHEVPEGTLAAAWVVDFTGVQQRQLYNNTLLSVQGETYWDGKDENGNICLPGIYAIVVELLLADETHKKYVLAVALGD